MAYNVTLIKGDGIGPEIAEVTKKCIAATGVKIIWEEVNAGITVMDEYGTPLPDNVIESIKNNKVALKAPVTTPLGEGFRSVNVALRQELDLYACVRPCKYYPGIRSLLKHPENVDIVIIRENTEDVYAGIEFEQGKKETLQLIKEFKELNAKADIHEDSGISIKPISLTGSERIIRYAFEYAKKYGRKKVSAVTKSNIMKYTDGLFQHVAERISKEYPLIKFQHILVDNLCMQLVQKPEEFDVLVLPNLYGDIISDLGAGLIGGLGVAPGANIGEHYAVFEATHGSAPQYAGQNKVNPTALILTSVLLLRHLGEKQAADKLERAVAKVIKEGKHVTYDLKEDKNDLTSVGTKEMADAIIAEMRASS